MGFNENSNIGTQIADFTSVL